MKIIHIVLLVSAWLLFSCSGKAPEPKPLPDGMPTYQDFEKKVQKYPYSALPERSKQITSGLSKVTVCMTKAQIKVILGVPDFSELDYGPKGPSEKWLGSSWTYYISKRDDNTNLNDPSMTVFFDTNDRAYWIHSNIKREQEIGAIGKKCT